MSIKDFFAVFLYLSLSATQVAYPDDAKEPTKGAQAKSETPKRGSPKPSAVEVGKRVPEFWSLNAGGQAAHIDDAFLRTKWVLVEFWAAKDQPRSKDQERLTALRQKYLEDNRLVMFSICVDLEFPEWLEYVNSQKDLIGLKGNRIKFYTDGRWWQLIAGANDQRELDELIKTFGLQKTPRYFLIRPDKTLAAAHIPKEKLEDVLAEHLSKAASK